MKGPQDARSEKASSQEGRRAEHEEVLVEGTSVLLQKFLYRSGVEVHVRPIGRRRDLLRVFMQRDLKRLNFTIPRLVVMTNDGCSSFPQLQEVFNILPLIYLRI